MKVKNRLFKWVLLVVALTTSTTINAQETMDTGQMLSVQQQSIVGIAALTAKGDLSKLKPALHAGLDAGWTVNEIKEAIIHLYAYAGFPDRKSTRLNSSHVKISYAVFCLKR